MIIEAKSKTFLVGEYCVIHGGSAILLCTEPKFKLRIKKSDNAIIRGIPEGSPAFTFYQRNRRAFDGLFIKFTDPYKRAGGFGASSAQFVLLYKLYRRLTKHSPEAETIDIAEFLDEYREISAKNQLVKPSGADCVAQIQNSNVYFDSNNNKVENLTWNFSGIDFVIFRTGNKLPTHSHLKELSPDFICKNYGQLTKIVEAVKESWMRREVAEFSTNVMNFFYTLNEMGLVAKETNKLVEKILNIEGVIAAKGCGAMAADTIIVIFEKVSKNKIVKLIKNILKESRF